MSPVATSWGPSGLEDSTASPRVRKRATRGGPEEGTDTIPSPEEELEADRAATTARPRPISARKQGSARSPKKAIAQALVLV